jgi:hypothetical protein
MYPQHNNKKNKFKKIKYLRKCERIKKARKKTNERLPGNK